MTYDSNRIKMLLILSPSENKMVSIHKAKNGFKRKTDALISLMRIGFEKEHALETLGLAGTESIPGGSAGVEANKDDLTNSTPDNSDNLIPREKPDLMQDSSNLHIP